MRKQLPYKQLALAAATTALIGSGARALTVPDTSESAIQKATESLLECWQTNVPKIAKNRWLPIPDWLAGTWCSIRSIQITPDKTLPKKKQVQVDIKLTALATLGTAKDGKGRVWQYAGSRGPEIEQIGDIVETTTMEQYDISNPSPDLVETRVTVKVQESNRQTGKLYYEVTEKSIVTHKRIAPDQIFTTVIVNDYDGSGDLVGSFRDSCTELRVNPFEQKDLGNLQPLFDQFIRTAK